MAVQAALAGVAAAPKRIVKQDLRKPVSMTRVFRMSSPAPWQDQIFGTKSDIVRRSVASVEREMGREALELEVRRRGFHLIEAADQFIIVCRSDPLRVIC